MAATSRPHKQPPAEPAGPLAGLIPGELRTSPGCIGESSACPYADPSPMHKRCNQDGHVSTKIHNGRIMRNASLEQALAALVELRPAFVAEARKAVATVIARKLAFGHDLRANVSLVDEARDRWTREKIIEQFDRASANQDDRLLSISWDFTFSVAVIPHEGDVLMLTYGPAHPPFATLIEDAGFTDFHYQNSTDRPDEITEEEWEVRAAAWDEALPTGRAMDVAYEFNLATWFDVQSVKYDPSLIGACEPSEHQRRQYVAQHLTELEEFRGCAAIEDAARIFMRVKHLAPARAEHVHLSSTPKPAGR